MGGSAGNSYVNIINNYYISGPSSSISAFTRGTPTFVPYVSGNFYDSIPDGILNGRAVPRTAYEGVTTFQNTPYAYPDAAANAKRPAIV